MIEEKIQIILPIILRNVGPLLLRGGLGGLSGGGGGGGTTNNNDDDDFDDDDDDTNTSVKAGEDGSKVSVSLPTFPPDTDEDEDDEDNSGAGAPAADGSNANANEDGNSTNSGSTSTSSSSSSSSSDAENNVDSNANVINPTSDQPNVSSPDVETQTYAMDPIQTSDSSPTVNSPEAADQPQPTTSSQPSENAIATNKPDTLTGFNNENATPTNVDRNTNLVFSKTDDNNGNESTTIDPDDVHQFIDIRSGFETSANLSETQTHAPTLSNTPDTSTEKEYARNEARRRQADFQ